jgi:adenylate cyclase
MSPDPHSDGRSTPATTRVLVAVLHVDVVGYSRLIGLDDLGTLDRLHTLREHVIQVEVARHGGRIHQSAGDSLLITFGSVSESVACAIEIQRHTPVMEANQVADRQIRLRAGIAIGDVIFDGTDLHGNGVNIAVRLQTMCPVGDVCVSRDVYDQVRDRVPVRVHGLGAVSLKNITVPVEAFVLHVASPDEDPADDRPRPARAVTGSTANGTTTRSNEPSIAVLPFQTLSGRPNDRFFCDGIVEDIIHILASLKELFVISLGSTLRYAGDVPDTATIARELDVRYVLRGSVRRSARAIRITTQLTDTTDARVIRSDQYDGIVSSLFALQERIAVQVAAMIVPQVRERELRRAMRKHPSSMTAYDLVLQALDALYRMTYQPFLRARELLQEAIALDPDYAPAYTYAAYSCIFQVGEGWSVDPAADARISAEFAAKAIERDPNDPVALAIYGHVQSFLFRDYNVALDCLERAVEAGPSCALAWTMMSATYGYLGQGDRAVEMAERGLRHSPLDTRVFWPEGILGQAHYIAGNYDQAEHWTKKALSHSPTAVFNLRTLAASLVAAGKREEAHWIAERLLRILPNFRLEGYARNCPFQDDILTTWIDRLRDAGLPD